MVPPPDRSASAWRVVAACLVAGLALRLWIAPQGAHPGDLPPLTEWARVWVTQGWAAVYTASSANYPPLGTALIGWAGRLYVLLAGAPPDAAAPLWSLCVKLPAILADTALAWLLARRAARPALAAAVIAFNPALIMLSAWWGQLESVYMLGVVVAFLAAEGERPFWAGLGLAAGVMVKLQAVVAAPALALMLLRGGGAPLRRLTPAAVGAALPLVVALLPYTLIGQGAFVVRRTVALISAPSWLTVNGLNLWYLVTGGAGNWQYNAPMPFTDATPLIGGVGARPIGLVLLAGWVLAVCGWFWWRRVESRHWVLAAALLYVGVFFFPTQAHERYAFGAVVLAWLWWASGVQSRAVSALLPLTLTGLHTANLLWAAPAPGGVPLGMVIAGGWALWVSACAVHAARRSFGGAGCAR